MCNSLFEHKVCTFIDTIHTATYYTNKLFIVDTFQCLQVPTVIIATILMKCTTCDLTDSKFKKLIRFYTVT